MTPEDRKLYDMEAVMMKAKKSLPLNEDGTKVWNSVKNRWDPISLEEIEQYVQGTQIGDNEWAADVLAAGGPTIAPYLDPSKAKYVQRPTGSWAGRYVPNYEHASALNERIKAEGIEEPVGGPVEEGDILLAYPFEGVDDKGNRATHQGTDPITTAHEFMHVRDADRYGTQLAQLEVAHLAIYVELGMNARTKNQWADIVKSFMYRYAPDATFEEGEQKLRTLIEESREKFTERANEAQSLLGLPRE